MSNINIIIMPDGRHFNVFYHLYEKLTWSTWEVHMSLPSRVCHSVGLISIEPSHMGTLFFFKPPTRLNSYSEKMALSLFCLGVQLCGAVVSKNSQRSRPSPESLHDHLLLVSSYNNDNYNHYYHYNDVIVIIIIIIIIIRIPPELPPRGMWVRFRRQSIWKSWHSQFE